LLTDLLEKGIYKNLLLSLTDDPDAVVNTILQFQERIEKAGE
jgi:hypothetical protein